MQGVNWLDVVILNNDAFKPVLLDPRTLPMEQMEIFSGLTHDEACQIRLEVLKDYKKRLEKGTAPHLLIDQTMPIADPKWPQFEPFTLAQDPNMLKGIEVTIVSKPVGNSLLMAFKRGEETGRYETTQGILTTHKNIAIKFLDSIALMRQSKDGAKIKIHCVANLEKKGDTETFAEISVEDGVVKINVLNDDLLDELLKKMTINTYAKNSEEIYPPQEEILKSIAQSREKLGLPPRVKKD